MCLWGRVVFSENSQDMGNGCGAGVFVPGTGTFYMFGASAPGSHLYGGVCALPCSIDSVCDVISLRCWQKRIEHGFVSAHRLPQLMDSISGCLQGFREIAAIVQHLIQRAYNLRK